MLKLLKRIGIELLTFALVFVCVASLFAQDGVSWPIPADQAQAFVIALLAAALPFGVAVLKKLIPGMPRILIWALGPTLGFAITWITSIGGLNGWKGFAAGLMAVALHEAKTTIEQHGLNG